MRASGVSAEIRLAEIPFSQSVLAALKAESDYLKTAITGGDDYEILFTVSQSKVPELQNALSELDFSVTQIGAVHSGTAVRVLDAENRPLELGKTSYDHSG